MIRPVGVAFDRGQVIAKTVNGGNECLRIRARCNLDASFPTGEVDDGGFDQVLLGENSFDPESARRARHAFDIEGEIVR
jgi:hypothetical protein